MDRDTTRALTLYQPFASLIVSGAKKIETRSWTPPGWLIGRRIAIHAGRHTVDLPRNIYPEYNITLDRVLGTDWRETIPNGVIVATAFLASARPMNSPADFPTDPDELLFGEYELGRWMWDLEDVQPLDPPVPATGHQGLWRWNPDGPVPAQKQPTSTPTHQPPLI